MVRAMSCLSQYSYFKNAESALAERPDRNVVPHPGVAFEAILQQFRETQLAARIESGGAEGGDQGGHGVGLGVMWGREWQKVRSRFSFKCHGQLKRYFDSGAFGSLAHHELLTFPLELHI